MFTSIFSEVASIIAILFFIPVIFQTTVRPIESVVYEKDSNRFMYYILLFFRYIIAVALMIFLCFVFWYVFKPQSSSLLLLIFKILISILFMLKAIRMLLFGVQTKAVDTSIANSIFFLIPLILIVGVRNYNILSIIIAGLSWIILVIGYLSNYIKVTKNKIPISSIRGYEKMGNDKIEYLRSSYRNIILINILLLSVLSGISLFIFYNGGIFLDGLFDYGLIFVAGIIICISEVISLTQFEYYNVIHDSCFIYKNNEVYFLESFSDNVIRMKLYGLMSLSNNEFGEYPINKQEVKYFLPSQIADFTMIDNPKIEAKFY